MKGGEPPTDAGFQVSMIHGERGCDSCGSLLCVQQREFWDGTAKGSKTERMSSLVEGTIPSELTVNVADDVERIICAGCGAVLWERDE